MKIDSFNSLLVIKRVAKEKGITMAEIAERLGISPINLSTSLNGNPTLKRLKEVADVLGVPVRDLFAEPSSEHNIIKGMIAMDNSTVIHIENLSDLYFAVQLVEAMYKRRGISIDEEKRYLTHQLQIHKH